MKVFTELKKFLFNIQEEIEQFEKTSDEVTVAKEVVEISEPVVESLEAAVETQLASQVEIQDNEKIELQSIIGSLKQEIEALQTQLSSVKEDKEKVQKLYNESQVIKFSTNVESFSQAELVKRKFK